MSLSGALTRKDTRAAGGAIAIRSISAEGLLQRGKHGTTCALTKS